MARLTVNEAGTSGYTDEIILTPGDFAAVSGGTTITVPVKKGDVIEGAALDITEAFSTSANFSVGHDGTIIGGAAAAEAFIANKNVNTTTATPVADSGGSLDDDGNADANKLKVTADGNIDLKAASSLADDTSGKLKVLLKIRRVNF
jgi:hypothetical protein